MSESSFAGLLLVDKPAGPTSHDIVSRVRRGCRVRRVGHAGTLDPAATGLLPLVIGPATRLVRFLSASPKYYRGSLRLGLTTTTDDETGEVTRRFEGKLPEVEEVRSAARDLVGRQEQVPPDYSARRVGGQRLYRMARKGIAVAAPAAEIDVLRFELEPTEAPDLYEFTVEVSTGTYVRALARDLGRALDCGGVLTTLVRTGAGPMRLDDATTLPDPAPDEAWLQRHLIPIDRMPLSPPPLRLATEAEAIDFRHGARLAQPARTPDQELVRVLTPAGTLLGIAELRDGTLHPRVVLATESGHRR